jgi:2',3'-cyclic-nucleotide 2'-phosphodiesterase (5'-nucleotidase family)
VGSGDLLLGDGLALASKGGYTIDLLKAAGFSFASFGARSLLHAPAQLEALARRAASGDGGFPLAWANGERGGSPFLGGVRMESVGGRLIGFFGVASSQTPSGAPSPALGGASVSSPLEAAQRAAEELVSAGCDAVVCCSDLSWEEAETLSKENPLLIAAIIGMGPRTGKLAGGALFCSAGPTGEGIGLLTLSFGPSGGPFREAEAKALSLEGIAALEPSESALAAAKSALAEAQELMREELGSLASPLENGPRSDSLETALGSLVSDSVRSLAGADAALVRSSLIRAGLPKGVVSRSAVHTALPSAQAAIVAKVSPARLKELLEICVGDPESFAQVSGIRFAYSPSLPKGSRVAEIWAGEKKLDLSSAEASLTLATDEAVAFGQGAFGAVGPLDAVGESLPFEEALAVYIREALQAGKALDAPKTGRITASYQPSPTSATQLEYALFAACLALPLGGLAFIAWATRPSLAAKRSKKAA